MLDLPPYTLLKKNSNSEAMESFVTDNFDYLFSELKLGDVGSRFGAVFDEAKRLRTQVSLSCSLRQSRQ